MTTPTSADAPLGKLLTIGDQQVFMQNLESASAWPTFTPAQMAIVWTELTAQRRRVAELEAENARLKELARPEHELLVSIEKRLHEIGHLSDSPDANITGAIHGLIDGYVSYRADLKAAEVDILTAQQHELFERAETAEAERDDARQAFVDMEHSVVVLQEEKEHERPTTNAESAAPRG